MENVYPQCRLCGKPAAGGLYDGIYLKSAFICGACEQTISRTEADAAGEYEKLLAGIRQLLIFSRSSRSRSGNNIRPGEKFPFI